MLTPEIKTKINQLWDKFWSNSISTRYNVIEQISYLIFIRWLEDTNSNIRNRSKEAAVPFVSLYEGEFLNPGGVSVPTRMMRWSYLKQMDDKEKLLEHLATTVFPWLKTLPSTDYPFSQQMAGASFLIPNSLLLDEAIRLLDSIVDEIMVQQSDGPDLQDTLGDVYAYLLHDISDTTSDAPPSVSTHLIDLMCELALPTLDDLICDPSCGTGDFLVYAGQRVLKGHTSPSYLYKDENGFDKGAFADLITGEDKRRRFERDLFTGVEKDVGQLRLATMNLMVHGVDRPLMSQDLTAVSNGASGLYTLVISNPANAEESSLLEKIIEILAPGGRAVVLASAVLLSDKSYLNLRRYLFGLCEVQALIQLPSGATPAAMDKAAILVFKKRAIFTPLGQEEVWFYQMVTDGYNYSADGQKSKLPINPLPEIAAAFHARNSTGKPLPADTQICRASMADIGAREYSLDIKRYQTQPAVTSLETLDAAGTRGVAGSKIGAAIGTFIGGPIGAIIGGAMGAATTAGFLGKVITKGSQIAGHLSNILVELGDLYLSQPASVIHRYIRLSYANNPFTFRELQTALFAEDDSMTFEKVHEQVWSMLKADSPVLRQVYYDARMARTYPKAYQFLRNKKAENGIYLLYTASITTEA